MSDEDFCLTHGAEHMRKKFGEPVARCGMCEDRAELIQTIAAEARRYAEMYQPNSDGRNTFVMFADWVEKQ